MNVKTILAAGLIALSAAACSQNEFGPKRTVGTLGGAALGGLVGAQFGSGTGGVAATAAGVVLGGLIGSEIGRELDEADRLKAEQAYSRATTAPVGQTIAWNNPETGNYGSVTPTREGTHTSTGEYCREFQQTVIVGGEQQDAYGTACRKPDGSWEIQ